MGGAETRREKFVFFSLAFPLFLCFMGEGGTHGIFKFNGSIHVFFNIDLFGGGLKENKIETVRSLKVNSGDFVFWFQ